MSRTAILVVTLLALSGWTADKAAAQAMAESAERHMQVGRYYVSRHDYAAALNRFKLVITRHQSSEYAEEVLAGLSEAYLAFGITSEARTAVAVLQRKFPDGHWSAKARATLTSAGLEPFEDTTSWISRAFQ
jgi:outer membrane protein assembly factor BamD